MKRTTEIPATDVTQCALHEATGHLYDALAEANYIATAERSLASVEICYELEEEPSSS